MDKTIKPNLSSSRDTIFPSQGLFKDLDLPSNDRLEPSFLVFQKGEISKVELEEDKFNYTLGSAEDCDVVLNDELVADIQVNVIILGDECYFMDCGDKDIVKFDGVKRRQLVSSVESRVVIKIGDSWIVYVGVDANKYDETDSILIQRSLLIDAMNESYGEVLLKHNEKECYSTKKPILVGSHNSCDFKIDHPEVKPFHFMINYTPRGVYFDDITGGRTKLKLNGHNTGKTAEIIKGDSVITLGEKLEVFLYAYEDIEQQCRELFKDFNSAPNLVLTHLRTPGEFIVLPKTSKRLSMGRLPNCDIVVEDDAAVSSIHAYLMVRDKYVLVQDNGSRNKTFVNLKEIDRAKLLPGQIIEMGDSCYMLHYQE